MCHFMLCATLWFSSLQSQLVWQNRNGRQKKKTNQKPRVEKERNTNMPASSFELNRFFICHFSRSLRLLRDRLVIITPSSVSVWTVDATAVWQTNTLTNDRAKNRRRIRSMNSYVEHCRNDIKNMIHWIANTFPITNDKSQIDRVQVKTVQRMNRERDTTRKT